MRYKRNLRDIERAADLPARVVGLTGGIGSGKTIATDTLKTAGYTVIDADEISRTLFAAGSDGERELIKLFPQAKNGKRLDRKVLRAIISADPKARTKLNDFTHPLIVAEIKRLLAKATPPIVLSAPLLFESALGTLCDKTVCVYCPRDVRIARIVLRDGVTEKLAADIIDAQIPDTERCTLADYIVPSNVPQEEFIDEIVELFETVCVKPHTK